MSNALNGFADNLHGAPGEFFDYENGSVERWEEYLREMAKHFYNSVEDNSVGKNGFDDKINLGHLNEDNKFKEWVAREKELENWREEEWKKGIEMLMKVHGTLWD